MIQDKYYYYSQNIDNNYSISTTIKKIIEQAKKKRMSIDDAEISERLKKYNDAFKRTSSSLTKDHHDDDDDDDDDDQGDDDVYNEDALGFLNEFEQKLKKIKINMCTRELKCSCVDVKSCECDSVDYCTASSISTSTGSSCSYNIQINFINDINRVINPEEEEEKSKSKSQPSGKAKKQQSKKVESKNLTQILRFFEIVNDGEDEEVVLFDIVPLLVQREDEVSSLDVAFPGKRFPVTNINVGKNTIDLSFNYLMGV